MRTSVLVAVFLLVKTENRFRAADQDRPLDQIRLLHHQVDRFLLRFRQRPLLEHRAPPAHEIQEVLLADVLLEERAVGGSLVDVPLIDLDTMLLQKTSGVAACRSRGLPVKDRLGHRVILVGSRVSGLGIPPASSTPRPTPRKIRGVLTVNEIFHSIQGESTHAGRPCVFVRLTACDLRCSWCDTPYAFHEGRKMSVDEVVAQVKAYDCPVVEITGGEPLLQREVYPLMQRLLDERFTVMLETGGHRSIADVPGGVIRVMDVKCPGSGEAHRNDWTNIDHLGLTDEVKFVIKDRADYEYAKDVVGKYGLVERAGAVLFSPVHGVMDAKELATWILEDRLGVRMQLQIHKFIWDPQTRGV